MTVDGGQRLTAAADTLAAYLTAGVTPGPWSADPTGTVCADMDLHTDSNGGQILPAFGPMEVAECYRCETRGERAANAAYIAAMDPMLGEALMDLLRDLVPASGRGQIRPTVLRIADLILTKQPPGEAG